MLETATTILMFCMNSGLSYAYPISGSRRQAFGPMHPGDIWEVVSMLLVLATLTTAVFSIAYSHYRSWHLEVRACYELYRKPGHRWYLLAVFFAMAIIMVIRLCMDTGEQSVAQSCQLSLPNSDIGGVGVLIGLYVPVFLIFLSLAFAHQSCADTGTLEVGETVLVNMTYLTFNLGKALLDFSRLSYLDKIIIFITIDASNSALSMARCSKECLAARWYISLSTFIQFVSFAVQFSGLYFAQLEWSSQHHCCNDAIWWARLSDCQPLWPTLWLYMALQVTLWIDVVLISHRYAPAYDIRQKDKSRRADQRRFSDLYTTVFPQYWFQMPLLLVNVVALSFLLRYHTEYTVDLSAWGQSAQLITCIFVLVHWCYIYYMRAKQYFFPSRDQTTLERQQPPASENRSTDETPERMSESAARLRQLQRTLMRRLMPAAPSALATANSIFSKPLPGDYPPDRAFADLLRSIELGDALGLQEAIDHGAAIDRGQRNEDGSMDHPLNVALMHRQHKLFRDLLRRGARPLVKYEEEDGNGRKVASALHLAAKLGEPEDIDIIRMILRLGDQNPDALNDEGATPLICAVQNRNYDAVEVLLDHNASINAMTPEFHASPGLTPLMLAVLNRDADLMQLLVLKGADMDIISKSGAPYEEMTAKDMAINEGNHVIEAILNNVEEGGDPWPRGYWGY